MRPTTLCYLERGDQYLMLHRTKKENDLNHDKWIGVGGGIEPGETPEQGLLREVFEETGIRVRVDRRYRAENRYNIRHDTQKLAVIFAAVTDQEQLNPQPEEIAEVVWVPVEQASARLTYERDRRILRDAFAHVTGQPVKRVART